MRVFAGVLCVLLILAAAGCGGDREGRKHMVPGLWQSDLNDLFSVLSEEHPDLYREIPPERLAEAGSSIIDSLGFWENEKIIVELSRLLALIGDGSTSIERDWLDSRFRRLPVELGYFGGDLRVVSAAEDYRSVAGMVLTGLGGMPVSKAVNAVRPLISRDNYAEWLVSVPRWLTYGEVLHTLGFAGDRFTVEAVFTGEDGGETALSLKTIDPDSLDRSGWTGTSVKRGTVVRPAGDTEAVMIDMTEGPRPAAVLRYIGPDMGASDTERIIRESFDGLNDAPVLRLILDMRGLTSRSRELAEAMTEGASIWKERLEGRDIVVLVDRGTCCSAIEIASRLGEDEEVTLAGELPRGAPGLSAMTETFRLPNSGVRIRIPESFSRSVPRLASSPWLPLDIHVRVTWDDHATGYDAPLDTALACPAPTPAGETPERGRYSDMALIPASEYIMGGPETDIYAPGHLVFVDSFYIDRHEVTNAQYMEFCEETGGNWPEFWGMDEYHCGPGWPDYPVVGVSLYQARLYAEWAGKRIPTEAEWELAARGGLTGSKFPTGDRLLPVDGNCRVSGWYLGTVPVGCYAPNGYGLYDMAGNVVEWVNDYFHPDYYRESPYRNPTGPPEGYIAVIRGGGWHSGRMCCNVYTRNACKYTWVDIAVGFRCAADMENRPE